MNSSILDSFGSTLANWWWVALFIMICLLAYEHSADNKKRESTLLQIQLQELQTQKQQALEFQKDLMQQINSQSDPAWVELTLMKVLGLSPEGQTKVLYK